VWSLYFGTTDIDLEAAEGYTQDFRPAVGTPTRASLDPIHPPILGIAHRGVDEKGPWLWFVFAIGSLGNYRDGRGGLDGMGVGLTVQRVTSAGLFGNWGPFGIVKDGRWVFLRVPAFDLATHDGR
jgi:hypothetical protein